MEEFEYFAILLFGSFEAGICFNIVKTLKLANSLRTYEL